jgi:predicted DNA-binding transcriptional regulator AlpA
VDAERLKRRFDAWEARMRGHSRQPYHVAVEPEYRPLLGRERIDRGVIDDARTPGFFERLRKRPKREWIRAEPEPIAKSVPFEGSGEMVELQLLTRPDSDVSSAVGAALITSLAAASHHLAFEILAVGDRITVQLTCDEADLGAVRSSLRAHVPDVRVVEERDYLWAAWQHDDAFGVIVPFGLSDRVFRPLRAVRPAHALRSGELASDPLAEIIGRMDDLGADETLLLQVLFAPALAPWRNDLEQFVSSIEDVDNVLPLVQAKFSDPLFAAVVRIAATSPNEDRALSNARSLSVALISQTRSAQNELVALERGKISLEEEFADLVARQTRRRGMILARSELQTILHLPSAAVRSPRLARALSRTKAAPARVGERGLILGLNSHENRERPVALTSAERVRHIHIIGSSGSGKSTLLLSMTIQDIEAGNGFAVLDPHGDLIEDILARIPEERARDVVLFDPSDEAYPVGFNPLSAHSELERTLLASDFVAIFRRLSSTTFGDQMVSVLGNAVLAILESPEGGTLLDLRHLLVDKAFRDRFLERVEDDEVRHYWRHEYPLITGVPHASILTRLNTFLRPKILRYMVAQKDSRLDMRAVMDGKKILLAKLSRGLIGEENSHLLGSLVVAKIAQAMVSRQDEEAGKRMPFTLYLDEFHHFATPSIADILTGARKYALSLCLAHHEMRQLKTRSEDVASAVLTHPYTRIVFRVSEQDANALASGFSFFEPGDLENLGVGETVARVERPDFDFNLHTMLPGPVARDVRDRRSAAVRSASRATYASPRHDVEATLKAAHAESPNDIEPKSRRARTKQANASAESLTDHDSLPGRGGGQHKYLQSLVKRTAEARGFTASLEVPVLDGHGHVDVVLEGQGLSIACEISVSTGVEHEVGNLTKCLAADFDYALLISSNETLLDLARAELADADSERLRILTPGQLAGYLDELAGEPPKKARAKPQTVVGDHDPLLTTDAAAAHLGLARQTLAEMRVSGESPPYHKLGRRVMYKQSDLDAWLAQRRRRSTSDSGHVPGTRNRPYGD